MSKPRMLRVTLLPIVGFLLLGVYAGACGSAGSQSNATSNGSPTGHVSAGSDAPSGAGSDATTVPVGTADEGGLSTDDGGLSSDDGGLASDDGGVSSADGGLASDDGAIAVCVSPGASSTASASGYLGDWTPGDYPSDFTDAGDYLRATRGTSSSSCRTVT